MRRKAVLLFVVLLLPLPAQVVRENIEWLDVWMPDTNAHALPRVLLIGDSIARGYGKQVETLLKGKAYVARMATSKSLGDPALLEQISLVLREQAFDVIHFNNGMHGDGYSEESYAAAMPEVLATLRKLAPKARIVWATTTDVRVGNHLDQLAPRNQRILRRNELAVAFAKEEGLPVDDLFEVIKDHPDYHVPDGVHFNAKGYEALAAQVAASVGKVLP